MPQPAKTRARSSSRRSTRSAGDRALKRLQDSVDAAEGALKDLRKEMSRGSRALLADVEKTLRDARSNLRRVSKRIAKDFEEVQRAAAGKTARRRTTGKTARSTGTRTRTAARKK